MPTIFISGHRGMVGAALLREALAMDLVPLTASRNTLDLLDQRAVFDFLTCYRPEKVIIAAAKVGGIHANSTYPAEFIYENLTIATNLIEGSRRAGIKKLLFLGSSCIYPKLAPQPIKEEYLLGSALEPTNEAYAIAKIAGLKMCQYYSSQYGLDYHSAMPCNLYGPGDNYHSENAHVIPALIRRFHEAKVNGNKEVMIWGSGKPWREFLHVDDLARACFLLLSQKNPDSIVNVGADEDISILHLAHKISNIIGFKGDIVFDSSKPDGTLLKLLDISRIKELGWKPRIDLTTGITEAYQDFLSNPYLRK